MCGIMGIISQDPLSDLLFEEAIKASKFTQHRGPDNFGYWKNTRSLIMHHKLSILDLSERSNQPIHKRDVILSFNGEIYNWKKLIKQFNLKDCYFDGDVLIDLYNLMGIDFIKVLEGDFAISIYDTNKEKVYLIRDRLGVKPLLYYYENNRLYYSSEVKFFNGITEVVLEPNYNKLLSDLALWFWNDKEETYFRNIYNVEAGHYIEFDGKEIRNICYWDIPDNYYEGYSKDNIKKLLLDSVESRTDTQNDLGYLLSGGLDSSLVVSMASRLNDKVDTYTIFYEGNENNTDYFHALQLISENNNISNTVNKVSKENISMKMLKYLSYQMEEVVWDKVYFSMFENYRRSANDCKRIVITGQGSDEVWLGYYHDFPFFSLAEKDVNLDKLCDLFIEMNIKHKDFLTEEAYVIIKKSVYKIIQKILNKRPNDSHLNKVAYWATKTYLISNLMQEDRFSMAMSAETRSPFLNYNLVEAAFSLPDIQKVNNGNEKYILKQVGTSYLPTSITSRQKQAFVNPTSNYDDIISEFLDQHGLEIDTVPFFKSFFSEKFLKNIVQKNIDSELLWKIVGILVFLNGFKGDGNFYYE